MTRNSPDSDVMNRYKTVPAPYGLSDCWEWTGPTIKAGKNDSRYGYPSFHGKHILAHRYAWEMENRTEVPEGMLVRHECDNSLCINPGHLVLGTQRDNAMDAVKRGRHGNSVKSALACWSGHLRTPENTQEYMRKGRNGYPDHIERRCRVCINERNRRKRESVVIIT